MIVETPKFKATSEIFRAFVPHKDGGSIPIQIKKITVECKRTTTKFKFVMSKRGHQIWFSDSRDTTSKINGYNPTDFTKELAKMIGEVGAKKIVATLLPVIEIKEWGNDKPPTHCTKCGFKFVETFTCGPTKDGKWGMLCAPCAMKWSVGKAEIFRVKEAK